MCFYHICVQFVNTVEFFYLCSSSFNNVETKIYISVLLLVIFVQQYCMFYTIPRHGSFLC